MTQPVGKSRTPATSGMYAALDLHGTRGQGDPVYAFLRGAEQ